MGYVLLRVKEKRRLKLLAELQAVLDCKKLSPAHAARLRGKLYFTKTTSFYGIGRAALQAFSARQYAKGRPTALNDELEAALQFFIDLLEDLPPYKFYLRDDERRPLYIWSDAMWEPLETDTGGLVTAFVVYDFENEEWHRAQCDVGLDVIPLPEAHDTSADLRVGRAAVLLGSIPGRSHVA